VVLPLARYLRQVRDAQHLTLLREPGQAPADDLRDAAADAGVHLVEDERRHGRRSRAHDLERETDAREFPARRDARQRAERLPRIEPHLDVDTLEPRAVRALARLRLELDAQLAVRHAELA